MKNVLSCFRIACATAAVTIGLTTIAPAALAQTLPAGVQGWWRVTKQLPKHAPTIAAGCNSNPAFSGPAGKNTRVRLSDHDAIWGTAAAESPAPVITMVETAEFTSHYLRNGVTLKDLGLAGAQKIEVIHFASPANLPFDTIVVKDPSTLYFEQCGLFTEAVHDSGFVAPPLPNQQQ